MNQAFEVAYRGESTVLLQGETGTGKSRMAREIHERSRRSGRPFVSVNLASLHEGVLESELFGHEKGAFTGADSRRMGRLEAAQGGTVFLDEVGELTPRLQARLLEFLQSRIIVPVGSNREVKLNVRVIVATHRNLAAEVAKGTFREDLFHRFRVVTLQMPTLRSRPEEIPALAQVCLQELAQEFSLSVPLLSPEAADLLKRLPWPGNIRELRNCLEYALPFASESGFLMPEDLPEWARQSGVQEVAESAGNSLIGVLEIPLTDDYSSTVQRFEKEYLFRALQRFQGRVNLTARKLGMSKSTLIRRMRIHGLRVGEPGAPVLDLRSGEGERAGFLTH